MAGATKVYGFEQDPKAIEYAKKLISKKGFSKKVEIIEGDCFKANLTGLEFDIIVNENLSPLLKFEPQIPISKLFSKNAKPHTRYVPLGVKFMLVCKALEENNQILGEVRFDELSDIGGSFDIRKRFKI